VKDGCLVAIDPAVALGRPVIAGSRVPTVEIFERFIGGESPDEIAADFGRTLEEVHEAIRCENTATAAPTFYVDECLGRGIATSSRRPRRKSI